LNQISVIISYVCSMGIIIDRAKFIPLIRRVIAREFIVTMITATMFLIASFVWNYLHIESINNQKRLALELTALEKNEVTEKLEAFTKQLLYLYDLDGGNPLVNNHRCIDTFNLDGVDSQVLVDYVERVKCGKYAGDWKTINSKFPEFGFTKRGLPKEVDEAEYDRKNEQLFEIIDSFFFNNKPDKYQILQWLAIILYGLRFLVYCTIWSIKEYFHLRKH